MLKDRTYKFALIAWLAVAIFLSAGLVSAAEVSDTTELSLSVAPAEGAGPDADAVPPEDADNVTEVAATTANDTVDADEEGTVAEPVEPSEPVTSAGMNNETEDEVVAEVEIEPEPEMEPEVEPEVEPEMGAVVEGAILTVCLSGCDYTAIQAAVEASEDGDVVEVGSGTYNENLVLDKSITLRGVDTGEGAPVVNGRGSGSVVVLQADGAVLEGLYITNAGPYPSAGIEVVSNDNLISGCEVWNSGWWGIYLKGGSTNNTVSECISSNSENHGIMVFRSPGNFFTENTVSNNGYNGIQILESDDNVVERNVVGNNTDSGISIDSSKNSIVMGNIISYNSIGIRLASSGIDRVGPNRFINNTQELEVT